MNFVSETVMEPGLKKQTRMVPAPAGLRVDPKPGPTMRAVYLEQTAGAEGLVAGEIPRPNPKDDEVLVKVHATSVMPAELDWSTTFNLPFGEPRPFPIVLSHEFSGSIESIGTKV